MKLRIGGKILFNKNHLIGLIDKGLSDKTIGLLLKFDLRMIEFIISENQENDQNCIEKILIT